MIYEIINEDKWSKLIHIEYTKISNYIILLIYPIDNKIILSSILKLKI